MRVCTFNLNGIRSAANKGLFDWVQSLGFDCMDVQEAQAEDVAGGLDTADGMRGHFHHAQKKGYSGVGLFTRKPPSEVIVGFGNAEFDAEGRYIEARYDTPTAKRSIISCYCPSGTTGEERQAASQVPLPGCHLHSPHATEGRARVHPAGRREHRAQADRHQELAQQPEENSGILPEERAWMTRLLEEGGLVDVSRTLNRQPEQYT